MAELLPDAYDPADAPNLEGVFRPTNRSDDRYWYPYLTREQVAEWVDLDAKQTELYLPGWAYCLKHECEFEGEPVGTECTLLISNMGEVTTVDPVRCIHCENVNQFLPASVIVRSLTRKGLEYLFDGLQSLRQQAARAKPTDAAVGGLRVFVESASRRTLPAGRHTGRVLDPDGVPTQGSDRLRQGIAASAEEGRPQPQAGLLPIERHSYGSGSQAQGAGLVDTEGRSLPLPGAIDRFGRSDDGLSDE